ncbi:MAG TPA: carbohydrate-binding family 9-like protein [Kofleriaceae bacterium]|jgi:hypothetical protein
MRAAVLFIALVAACGVDEGTGPQPKRVDPGYVGAHLLRDLPPLAPQDRVDVTLGGKVVYLGSIVDTTRPAPGGALKIKHYWKVLAPVGPGWRVFVQLRGAPNSADFMMLPPTDMQRAHGPATWRTNEIIEDEQDVVIRADWRSTTATVQVGLIAEGAHGTLDRMAATTAPEKVVDRAIVARILDVDLSKAPPPPGTVYVPRARGAITIDGVGTDPGWQNVPASPEFPTGEKSPDPLGSATAKITWDDQYLYVFASVKDTDILSDFKNHDDTLWKADVVEMFIDADSSRRGYVELQVNPNNATFDSWFATGRDDKAHPADPSWDSGMITAVKLNGSTGPGGSDVGWDAEIAIPWAAVKGRDDAMKVKLPPAVGDRWRLNVVRGDLTSDKKVAVSSWNRIGMGDWHAIDKMLTVVFADTMGGVVPNSPVDPRVPPPTPPADTGSGSASMGSGAGSGSAAPIVETGRIMKPANAGSGSASTGSGSGSASK